ncbi:MAG: hypothetical protein ACLTX6_02585 [Lachnospiraceae bacterium]
MLSDKIDVRREIETTLAAKKSEQMVMSLMPARNHSAILRLTSPGFLGCTLWKSCSESCAMTVMSCNLRVFLLARKTDRRY